MWAKKTVSGLRFTMDTQPPLPLSGDIITFKVKWAKNSLCVTLPRSATVSDLKNLIERETGYLPEMQKLMYKGLLRDEIPLSSTKIVQNAKVILMATSQDTAYRMTNFLKIMAVIPPEILHFIFAKIEEPHDLLGCVLVCKFWGIIAQPHLFQRARFTRVEAFKKWYNIIDLKTLGMTDESETMIGSYITELDLSKIRRQASHEISDVRLIAIVTHTPNLQRVNLSNQTSFSDEALVHLTSRLTNSLHHLLLANCSQLTGKGWLSIKTIPPGLKTLDLTGICTYSMLLLLANAAIACREMEIFRVSMTYQEEEEEDIDERIDSDELLFGVLERWRKLRILSLSLWNVDENFDTLAKEMECIKELTIGRALINRTINVTSLPLATHILTINVRRLDESLLETLSAHPTQFTYLDLSQCLTLTDDAVVKILTRHGTSVRSLFLHRCENLTATGLSRLGEECRVLEHLSLPAVMTDLTLCRILRSAIRLRSLDLRACNLLTAQTLTNIYNNSSSIEFLRLSGLWKGSMSPKKTLMYIPYMFPDLRYLSLSRYGPAMDVEVVENLIAILGRLKGLKIGFHQEVRESLSVRLKELEKGWIDVRKKW